MRVSVDEAMPIPKSTAGPGLPDDSLDSRILNFLGKPGNSDKWFSWVEIHDGVYLPLSAIRDSMGKIPAIIAAVGFQSHLEAMWKRGFIARRFFETEYGLSAFYSAKDPMA